MEGVSLPLLPWPGSFFKKAPAKEAKKTKEAKKAEAAIKAKKAI